MRVELKRYPGMADIDVYCVDGNRNHLFSAVISDEGFIELKEIPVGPPCERNPNIKPVFRMEGMFAHDFIYAFIAALREAHFLPAELALDPKELKAVRDHLEDMRTLVFKRRK